MTAIKFKSVGHVEEKEPGAIAMFGYGSRDLEDQEDFSFSFLVDTVGRGLEIMTIVFLLLLLCEYISFNYLSYILVPFTLTFLLASFASSVVQYGLDDSVGMSGFVSQCRKRISWMRLCALLSLFVAKCALIYIYSKSLNDVSGSSQSLKASSGMQVVSPLEATIPRNFFIISLVCICFNMIVESALLIIRILQKRDSIGRIYTLMLSLVDTLSISMFFLILRVMEQPSELMHFHKIFIHIPILFISVAFARFFVWVLIQNICKKNDVPTSWQYFGLIHFIVVWLNLITIYLMVYDEFLFALQTICGIAIAERFFLTLLHCLLGGINRKKHLVRENADPPSSHPASASRTDENDPFLTKKINHGPKMGIVSQHAVLDQRTPWIELAQIQHVNT